MGKGWGQWWRRQKAITVHALQMPPGHALILHRETSLTGLGLHQSLWAAALEGRVPRGTLSFCATDCTNLQQGEMLYLGHRLTNGGLKQDVTEGTYRPLSPATRCPPD